MLTEKIKEQIFAVRESGVANMCDMAGCSGRHLTGISTNWSFLSRNTGMPIGTSSSRAGSETGRAAFREGMPPVIMYTISGGYLWYIYGADISG